MNTLDSRFRRNDRCLSHFVIPAKAGIHVRYPYLLSCYIIYINIAFNFVLFECQAYILIDKIILSYLSLFIDGYLFLFFGLSTKNKKRSK